MERKVLRKWNNILHRDIGYLFFGMFIIYAISGIVLNHVKSGDFQHPDYTTTNKTITVDKPVNGKVDDAYVETILTKHDLKKKFKSYILSTGAVKIFLTNGYMYVDITTGEAELETKTTLHVIKQFNALHYNNIKKFYTWFSDVFAVAMIVLAITGLFVLRGKKGITGRGAWLTAVGIIIPAVIILIYL